MRTRARSRTGDSAAAPPPAGAARGSSGQQAVGGGRGSSSSRGPSRGGGARGEGPHVRDSQWEHLPGPLLSACFERLEVSQDLASAGMACNSWAQEIEDSSAWESIWKRDYGKAPLWRWACAKGGYRDQLRSSTAMQKGNCTIRTLPFSRKDGSVLEVLLLDANKQIIVTLQQRPLHPLACRLNGLTLKVWDEASLKKESPLLVVHDVLKHCQMEGGKLLCWKVADHEIIRVDSLASVPQAGSSSSQTPDDSGTTSVFHWAEDNRIKCYLIDPSLPTISEMPIDSTFGAGPVPHEWLDIPGGSIASVACYNHPRPNGMNVRTIHITMFDGITGQKLCIAENKTEGEVPVNPNWESETCMLVARSGASSSETLVLVASCLFDHRVYRWELPKTWLQGGFHALKKQAAGQTAQECSGCGRQMDTGIPRADLKLMFTCPSMEQVYDLAMSTPGGRIYAVAQENCYVFSEDGSPICAMSMSDWPGVPTNPLFMQDVGAFSWPLPNTTKIAFHLETTNSIYVADLSEREPISWEPHAMQPEFSSWRSEVATCAVESAETIGASPLPGPYANLVGFHVTPTPREWGPTAQRLYQVVAHLGLKPKPYGSSGVGPRMHTRADRANEPTILEHTHCGRVIVTVADTSLPGTQRSLQAEPQTSITAWDWGKQRVKVSPRRCAAQFQRSLCLIDTGTGRVFRNIPLRNCLVESVHSAGGSLAVCVGKKDTGYLSTEGALLLIDFLPGKEDISAGGAGGPSSTKASDTSRGKGKAKMAGNN